MKRPVVLATVSVRLKVRWSLLMLVRSHKGMFAVTSGLYRGLHRRDTDVRIAWIWYRILEVLRPLL